MERCHCHSRVVPPFLRLGPDVGSGQREPDFLSQRDRDPSRTLWAFQYSDRGMDQRPNAVDGYGTVDLGAQETVAVDALALLLPGGIFTFYLRAVGEYILGLSDGLVLGHGFSSGGDCPPGPSDPHLAVPPGRDDGGSCG